MSSMKSQAAQYRKIATIATWLVFELGSRAVATEEVISFAGETSLVLGRAMLISSDGSESALRRGMKVWSGDRIETYSNGHVHVRFVDDALLSVRPNSTLHIAEYIFDPDEPQNSAVKFNLQEGVARSISGGAAKYARDRFRLNTPVAAIGVRGTDFVVNAESQSTKALVNEGSIIIAPYSSTCLQDALGPCNGGGVELSREIFQLASLQADDTGLDIFTAQSVRAPSMLQRQLRFLTSRADELIAPDQAGRSQDSRDISPQALSNEVLLEVVTVPLIRSNAIVAADQVSATDFIPTDPITVSADGQVQGFDYTPPVLMTLGSLDDRQLVWGRYGDASSELNKLGLPFTEASSSRNISVGNLSYGLFRKDTNSRRVASDLGLVGFQLTSAQAVFNSQTGIAVMSVRGGSLDINFSENTFQTMLDLDNETIGELQFSAAGNIFDGGFLRSLEATQRLAGAVSYDGAEAGYFFEKQIGDGFLSGLTLWDTKGK